MRDQSDANIFGVSRYRRPKLYLEQISAHMITEADTCRKYVLPKLYAAGWNDDQINEQKSFTDGRIVVVGDKARR